MSALPAPRPIQPANDTALSPALGDERNEQKILGAVMMEGMKDPSNTAFKKIAHFKEHYFGWHIHRIVFRAMTLVYDEGMNVEYDSVHDRLKKMENKNISGQFAIEKVGEQFLGSLLTLKGSNITLLSELVLKAWVRRNETTAADNSKTWAADGNLTLSQFLEKTSSQATENMLVYSSLLGSRSQSMTEGMATVAADIAKDRSTPGAVGWIWHTGFQGLSDLMGGGFEAGAVYVFGGASW